MSNQKSLSFGIATEVSIRDFHVPVGVREISQLLKDRIFQV